MKELTGFGTAALMCLSVAAHGASVSLSNFHREVLATISPALVFTDGGSWHQSVQHSSGSATGTASQDSDILLSGNVLSVIARGDVNASNAQAWSSFRFNFTTDAPFNYHVSGNTGPYGRIALWNISLGGSRVFALGAWLNQPPPRSGSMTGSLPAGTYQLFADAESDRTATSPPDRFDLVFSLSPGPGSPPPPPSLSTAGGNLTIRWPRSATNAVVESTADLDAPRAWTVVTNEPTTDGAMFSILIGNSQARQFFRLTRTEP
jgi:hypothetical protein